MIKVIGLQCEWRCSSVNVSYTASQLRDKELQQQQLTQ